QRNGTARPESVFQFLKGGSPGKAEIKVKIWDHLPGQVIGSAVAKLGESDRRIDVIKSLDGLAVQDLANGLGRIRKIGSQHGYIRALEVSASRRQSVFPAAVDSDFAKIRFGEVAIRGVPLLVALEENDPMSPLRERPSERPKSSSVSIAPRRCDGQPEDDDLHRVILPWNSCRPIAPISDAATRAGAEFSRMISSNSAARRRYVWSRRARARMAAPISFACSAEVSRNQSTISSAEAATRISVRGAKNVSIPSQASVIKHAPTPAASKTRVGGENPTIAIDSRLTFNTMRAEQLIRL